MIMAYKKMNIKKERLTYDDVLLVPQRSTVESRSEVDLAQQLGTTPSITLEVPIISSPMDTVTETEMATAMHKMGGLGIIHRYNTIEDQVSAIARTFLPGHQTAAAIGVTGDFEERSMALYDAGAKILCIDVAHGHHILVERALKTLKDSYGNNIHLMAGNVATLEAFNDLADWGADSIRCGIGGGSICTTRIQTGHGVPGFATILECAQSDRDAKIIADGGIKNSGDIVKALAAGADFVMLGSLMAGTLETPGQLLSYTDGSKRKAYRGMASKKAQELWRGKSGSPEGIATTVHYKGSVADVINDLVGGIKSGCSYSGAANLKELRTKAVFIQQSPAAKFESSAHILARG
jgi:IMP dehydrogenase